MITRVLPSYANGVAHSAAESASPHLWRNLVGAWVPALGVTGATVPRVFGPVNGAVVGASWDTTRLGSALKMTADGLTYVSVTDTGWLPTGDCTIVVLLAGTPGPAANQGVFGQSYGIGTPYTVRCDLTNYSNVLYWDYGGVDAPNRISIAANLVPWTGDIDLVTCTAGHHGMEMWLNAKLVMSSYAAPATRTSTVGYYFAVGRSMVNAFKAPAGKIVAFLVFNARLLQGEIAELGADPLKMFRPSRRVFYSFPGEPPAGNRRRRILLYA